MKPSAYLETTVIGYLAMRKSSELRIAANQLTTRDWWENHREEFDLYVSRFVVEECSAGDSIAAMERLALLVGIARLEVSEEISELAQGLMRHVPLPEKAEVDSLHIATAAVHGIEYLVTWNCKHIANPSLRPRIERTCREFGYEPPSICTPQDLLEMNDGS